MLKAGRYSLMSKHLKIVFTDDDDQRADLVLWDKDVGKIHWAESEDGVVELRAEPSRPRANAVEQFGQLAEQWSAAKKDADIAKRKAALAAERNGQDAPRDALNTP
jgi:hypothetical protein